MAQHWAHEFSNKKVMPNRDLFLRSNFSWCKHLPAQFKVPKFPQETPHSFPWKLKNRYGPGKHDVTSPFTILLSLVCSGDIAWCLTTDPQDWHGMSSLETLHSHRNDESSLDTFHSHKKCSRLELVITEHSSLPQEHSWNQWTMEDIRSPWIHE